MVLHFPRCLSDARQNPGAGGKPFIGGTKPSIADMKLAAAIEFIAVVDYFLRARTATYMAAIERSLGNAYSELTADVRGCID